MSMSDRAGVLRNGYTMAEIVKETSFNPAADHDPASRLHLTAKWFDYVAKDVWDDIIPRLNPSTMLEIGSYEGASTCYLIDTLASRKSIEIHCVDTWTGGQEHTAQGINMNLIEQRFRHNTDRCMATAEQAVRLITHQGRSDVELEKLLCDGKRGYFDFIYIDGSHEAPDVLSDAILSFQLLKIGGIMAFDDYLLYFGPPESLDPINGPKLAIDAFTTIYARKLSFVCAPNYQVFLKKIAD